MVRTHIRKVAPQDFNAKDDLAEIFNDPEAGYIGWFKRQNLVAEVGKRRLSESLSSCFCSLIEFLNKVSESIDRYARII